MKNSGSKNHGREKTTAKKKDQTVEVLYQKMGDRWFAFSLIGDEVFVGSITQSEVDHPDSHNGQTEKVIDHS